MLLTLAVTLAVSLAMGIIMTMAQQKLSVVVSTAMICPDCGSTVYFAEDMGGCKIPTSANRTLLLDSSSTRMGEWDESFVDGLPS